MPDIQITVWNKYCWASGDEYALSFIYDMLSYDVESNFFSGSLETKQSFLTKKNAFKTGFLPFVYKELVRHDYNVVLNDKRKNVFSVDQMSTYIPIGELREYQEQVIHKVFNNYLGGSNLVWNRGIIDAATNAGKNWIIAVICLNLLSKSKILITIHRYEIFVQLYDFLTSCGITVNRYGKYEKTSYKDLGDVTLAMFQTLYTNKDSANVKKHLSEVGTLIVDEAHRASGKEYSNILSTVDASAVYYLSGTIFTGNKIKDLNTVGDSGEILATITVQDLIDEGVSQKPEVYMYKVEGVSWDPNYASEKVSIMSCRTRFEVISSYIKNNPDDVMLISVASIDHGHMLVRALISLNTTIEFIYASDPERHIKLQAFKDGYIKVLICTEVLKEGVNMSVIRTWVNAAWGKSITWVKQFTGRLIRHDGQSDSCTIIDFIDVGNNTSKHSYERMEIYKNEGFKVTII
jgi:superfamily II DNA or RNA helicase